MTIKEIQSAFTKMYHSEPQLYYAPGRVNIIGEHTDYNHGYVMPMAINIGTTVAIAKSHDDNITVYSNNLSEIYVFKLGNIVNKNAPSWTNYVYGLTTLLLENNTNLSGMNIFINSNLPMGAGLSSSASLSISLGHAILDIHGLPVNLPELTKISQQVEHQFIGTQCGIMDQTICAMAKIGHAMQLDCMSLKTKYIPFESDDVSLLICDTGVKHQLCSSEYNIRKQECDIICKYFHIDSLRHLGLNKLNSQKDNIPANLYNRAFHVITENQRVLDTSSAMALKDWPTFGDLLYKSHDSLRDKYNVSCSELDFLVENARGIPDIYGARMTGGGFGGCAIFLIRQSQYHTIKSKLTKDYKIEFNKNLTSYMSKPHSGVQRIMNTSQPL